MKGKMHAQYKETSERVRGKQRAVCSRRVTENTKVHVSDMERESERARERSEKRGKEKEKRRGKRDGCL